MVTELKYSATNTYLVRGKKGLLLFDTGWAGTFPQFCRALGEAGCSLQEIRYILISHYHPDHMGIAQEIASRGPVIAAADVQKDYIHQSDYIFQKEDNRFFIPVKDADLRIVPLSQSREFLEELGLNGEIIHTPGHSEDSISLLLDDGSLFVGDLNPLYELELHAGTKIEKSWKRLLEADPVTIYYGHAKTAHPRQEKKEGAGAEGNKKAVPEAEKEVGTVHQELYALVEKIIKYTDRGFSLQKIRKKTGAGEVLTEDVVRMYLTHRNVGVQGILDRIEIKGR